MSMYASMTNWDIVFYFFSCEGEREKNEGREKKREKDEGGKDDKKGEVRRTSARGRGVLSLML